MTSQLTNRYKTAIYLRLSREDIDKEGESASIENQRKILQRYAEEHSFTIHKEYIDDGVSGTTFERPAFQQLIKDIENKQINLVIIKDLSRLGRDYIKAGDYLENIFPIHKVRCIAVNDNYDSDNKNSNDFMPLRNVFNEFYAKDISKKIRATFKAKIEAGEYIGNFAPYGYQKDVCNKNHFVIDEQVAPVVRNIFKMAVTGINPAEIARQLNGEGIAPPAVYRCDNRPSLNVDVYSKYKQWSSGGVQKILKNIVYLGHMAQGKTERINHKNKTVINKSRNEWVIKKNTHAPIIDDETFYIARQRMQGRVCKRKKGFVNIFSGLAKCADCGKNMSTVGTRKKGAIYNLACGGYKLRGTKGCTNHFIDYDVLYSLVLKAIKEQIKLTEDDKQDIIKELQASDKNTTSTTKASERKRLQTEEQKLIKFMNSVYDDFYKEKISEDAKDRLIKQYSDKLDTVTRRLKALEAIEVQKEQVKESYNKFAEMIKKYTDIEELDSDILFTLIERIEVHQGHFKYKGTRKVKEQTVKIYFKFLSDVKVTQYIA